MLTAGSAALAMGAAFIGPGGLHAAGASTFTVTTLADSGPGSLRAAITGSAAGDTILFQPGLSGTIPVGLDMVVSHALTIDGTGASVTLDGGGTDRIFTLGLNGDAVTISNLTLTHGDSSGAFGGAIENAGGDLSLVNDTFTANSAGWGGAVSSDPGGSAAAAAGSLTILNSTLSGNTVASTGGAVQFYGKAGTNTLTITNSTFSGNTATDGGALYASGHSGAISVSGSTFTDNTATEGGGAVMVDDLGSASAVSIDTSTLTGNSGYYGGAIALDDADGGVTISGTSITGNHATGTAGGGIASGGGQVKFAITGSTISGNDSAKNGGGLAVLYSGADLQISGSTISNNVTANGVGGGVLVVDYGASLPTGTTIDTSTISGNQAPIGAGVTQYGGTGVTMTASTVSGNSATKGGGGVFVGLTTGKSTLANSTITGNTGGPVGGGVVFAGYYGLALLQDTIAANSGTIGGGVALLQNNKSTELGSSVHDALAAARAAKSSHAGAQAAHPHGQHDGDVWGAQTRGARAHASAGVIDSVTLSGTIVALNAGQDIGHVGTVTSDHSIVGSVDPGTTFTDAGGTQRNVDPLLGPLADNGGPTQTMELLLGSPAINAGPATVASFPGNEFDQRGPGFPRVTGGTVDIGAFEVQPVEIAPKFTG